MIDFSYSRIERIRQTVHAALMVATDAVLIEALVEAQDGLDDMLVEIVRQPVMGPIDEDGYTLALLNVLTGTQTMAVV